MTGAGLGWPRAYGIGAVTVLTLLGGFLRFHEIGLAPAFTDNADEIQFSWAGLNLLEHGDAYTWSYYPIYGRTGVLQAYGTAFPMVHHWLDHPPGFSLLLGGFLWLIGDRSMLGLTPEHVRLLPAVFSTFCIPLAYVLGRRAVGELAALCGAALLATGPAVVLTGREAEPESVLAPMLLVALLITARLTEGRAAGWELGVLLVLSFLAPLMKFSGLAVGGVTAAVLLMNGRSWPAWLAGMAAAAGVLAYVVYGWAVDWALFLRVLRQQAGNRTGLLAGINFVADPAGINRPLHDGWWLLGWIGLGLLLFHGRRSRSEQLLAWPVLAYALTIMVLAGQVQTGQYGWYRVILQPLVYVAAGAVVARAVLSPSPSRLAAVGVLGGATALNWSLGHGSGLVPNPVVAAAVLALLLLPSALVAWPRFGRYSALARGLATAAVALLVLGNVATSLELADIFVRM